ncbi:MAG: fasciclin domain-containing protein [Bacteroidaceae bacterium]|nr:fasciclin domain-containing protein [Bacteroidaceae bacterium]
MMAVALMTTSFFGVCSCEEEIDSSNFAIKTEQTLSDIVDADPNLSMVRDLFKRVKLGRSQEASSIYSVLSARGNYTVFVPDNVAMEKYLASLELTSIDELTDEQAELIAYSCVIDNGDQEAYQSTEFPSSAAFNLSNLYDRLLTCNEDAQATDTVERVKYDPLTLLPVIENGDTVKVKYPVYYKIEKTSGVYKTDLEASNGWMHIVADVIAPTSDYIWKVIQDAPNMKIMGKLLQETGIWKWMNVERDIAYEDQEIPENLEAQPGTFEAPLKRYLAFTGFVEPDSIFVEKYGVPAVQTDAEGNITNWDQILPALKTLSPITTAYGSQDIDDLTSPNNPLYKFVKYHFINGKLAPGKLVVHFTEYLYKYGNDNKNPQTRDLPTDAWDFYTTIHPDDNIDEREPIKLLQLGSRGPIGSSYSDNPVFINRFVNYDNGMTGTYEQLSPKAGGEGVMILQNKNISSANGYIYTIDDILVFGDAERELMGRERMRVDFTSIIHELSSNNLRLGKYSQFLPGYFENLPLQTTGSDVLYLFCAYSPRSATGWCNYQGDEMMVLGLYDVTFRIPPVPKANEYEIRLGVSHNNLRGMCQLYFGEDMNRLQPAGLPYDMRPAAGGNNYAIPWVADVEDEAVNIENDKNLRNQGYMKGPKHFGWTDGKGESMARAYSGHIRRIVTTERLEPGTSYYLRYKSALKKLDSQLQIDYIEIVPKEVYNGNEAEDVW